MASSSPSRGRSRTIEANVGDLVLRTSGLRVVAVATVLALLVDVARFGLLLLAGADGPVDAARMELARTVIGFSATTIGLLWIWGTIRAALGDVGIGRGLLALAGTVGIAAVGADTIVTLDPLLVADAALGAEAEASLSQATRICWAAARLTLVVSLARLAWIERRAPAMFGAAVALVVAAPILVVDPISWALTRVDTSIGTAWAMGLAPTLLVGIGTVAAVLGLHVPVPSVWQAFGRAFELVRVGLVGTALFAGAFVAAYVYGGADPVWFRVTVTGPLVLLGSAVALGCFFASRRSIRVAKWSFNAAALALVTNVALQTWVGGLFPLGVGHASSQQLRIVELVGLGLVVVALGAIVIGVSRVDAALKRPALTAGVLLAMAVGFAAAAIAFRYHPLLADIDFSLVAGAVLLLGFNAIVMLLHLMSKGIAVAEAHTFGERVRAAQFAAKQARAAHARWRAAKLR